MYVRCSYHLSVQSLTSWTRPKVDAEAKSSAQLDHLPGSLLVLPQASFKQGRKGKCLPSQNVSPVFPPRPALCGRVAACPPLAALTFNTHWLAQVKLARRNRCPTLSLPKSPPSQVSHAACPPPPRTAQKRSARPLSDPPSPPPPPLISNPAQSRNRTSHPNKPPNSRPSAQSRPRPTSAKLPPRKPPSNARTNSTSANPKPAPKRNSRKRPSNCGNREGGGIL